MAWKEQNIIVLEENEKVMKTYEHISQTYWVEIRDVVAMKNVAFPDIDAQHFMIAMSIAKKYDLDPSVKEIYGWEKWGRVTIVASNAWFLKIARKQEWFLKIISNAVYPEDEFEMDMLNDEVKKHVIHPEVRTKDSQPIGAYAILKMKDQPDQMKWVDWHEYVQLWDYSPWRKQKAAMIWKCATSVLLREAFWLSGLYGEEEMEQETLQDKIKKTKAVQKTLELSEWVNLSDWVNLEEDKTKQASYRDIMADYFNTMTINNLDSAVPIPQDFDQYTEKQAKKDYLIIQQQ